MAQKIQFGQRSQLTKIIWNSILSILIPISSQLDKNSDSCWALTKQKLSNGFNLSLHRGNWRIQIVPKWQFFSTWIIKKCATVSLTLQGTIRQNKKKSRIMITLYFSLLCFIFPYIMNIAVHIFLKLIYFLIS